MKTVLAALILYIPTFASAGIITGDSVIFQADPGVFGPVAVTVGAGTDLITENFTFDFNAGIGNDVFNWSSSPGGSLAGSTSVTLSDMDFVGGALLTGFSLISTVLSDLTWSTTSDSITFFYTSTGIVGPGRILVGQYKVPEPGTLAILALGLLGLGALRRQHAH